MPQLEMQVLVCFLVARASQNGDGLTCPDIFSLLLQQGGVVLVDGEVAVFMLDADAVAVVDAPVGEHYGAIKGGIDNLVASGGNVDAIVVDGW